MKRDPQRAKFEAFCRKRWVCHRFGGALTRRADGEYEESGTEFAWQAFREASPPPRKKPKPRMRAWKVTIPDWDPVFTMATSATSARMKALHSLRDAGYSAEFIEITARRAPDCDCLFEREGAFSNVSQDWIHAAFGRRWKQGAMPI